MHKPILLYEILPGFKQIDIKYQILPGFKQVDIKYQNLPALNRYTLNIKFLRTCNSQRTGTDVACNA